MNPGLCRLYQMFTRLQHIKVIKEVPADRLLVWQVKEGWEPLCQVQCHHILKCLATPWKEQNYSTWPNACFVSKLFAFDKTELRCKGNAFPNVSEIHFIDSTKAIGSIYCFNSSLAFLSLTYPFLM